MTSANESENVAQLKKRIELLETQLAASESRFSSRLPLALQEREALLSKAEEVAHMGSWIWDVKKNEVTWSDGLFRLLDYDPTNMTPSTEAWFARIHPDDLEVQKELSEESRKEGATGIVEHRLLLPGGVVRDVLTDGVEVRDEDGNFEKIVGTVLDITEQKQAHNILATRNLELEAIFQALPDLYFRHASDSTYIDCRAGKDAHLLLPPEVFLGKTISEVLPPDLSPIFMEAFEQVLANKMMHTIQYQLPFDGEPRDFEARLLPFQEDQVVSIVRDITTTRRAEQALRRSEERLQEAQRIGKIGSWEYDFERDAFYFSDQLYRILGLAPDETHVLRSLKAAEAHFQTRLSKIFQQMKSTALEKGQDVELELMLVIESEERWFHNIIRPADRVTDGWQRIVGTIQDITERKQSAEREKQHQLELLRADKLISLGTLVAGTAHEINNPNQFIMLNMPLIRTFWEELLPVLNDYGQAHPSWTIAHLPFEEVRQEIPLLIEQVLEGAERIKHIVSELRNFIRAEGPEVIQKANLNDIIRSALTLVTGRIKKETNAFSVHYDNNLPLVSCNIRSMEQVIINLVLNALDSLPSKDRSIELKTSYNPKTHKALFTIRDEGCGIPPEHMDKLKMPFFTTRQESGGTGLGLAVSFRIVERYHGELLFESNPGEGTTVTLSLPIPEDVP